MLLGRCCSITVAGELASQAAPRSAGAERLMDGLSPIRLQQLNQMPLHWTLDPSRSSTRKPPPGYFRAVLEPRSAEHQKAKSKAPRLPRGSGVWTGISHFSLPQIAAG